MVLFPPRIPPPPQVGRRWGLGIDGAGHWGRMREGLDFCMDETDRFHSFRFHFRICLSSETWGSTEGHWGNPYTYWGYHVCRVCRVC